MKRLWLIPFLCGGCAIGKFNQPPQWASVVSTHTRFYGLNADIPAGGSSVFKIQLGWGSHTWVVIPVSTNEVFAATVSDTFSLGQEISPFSTSIREDIQTGWKGTPPTPRHRNLFGPVDRSLPECPCPTTAVTVTNVPVVPTATNTQFSVGFAIVFGSAPAAEIMALLNSAGAVKKSDTVYSIANYNRFDPFQNAALEASLKAGATLKQP